MKTMLRIRFVLLMVILFSVLLSTSVHAAAPGGMGETRVEQPAETVSLRTSPVVQVAVEGFFVLFGLFTVLPLFASANGQGDCLDCTRMGIARK